MSGGTRRDQAKVWLADDEIGIWPKSLAYSFIALSGAACWAAIAGAAYLIF